MKNIFISLGLVLCFCSTVFAGSVELQWGVSAGATGYKVYYQADSSTKPFASFVDVKNVTTATIANLDITKPYFFALTAYNAQGEGTYSNVVTVTAPWFPETPTDLKVKSITISGSSVTIVP
jgi:chitinase